MTPDSTAAPDESSPAQGARSASADRAPAPSAAPAPAGGEGNGARPLLQLRDVSKHFGAVQALTEVALDIPQGQVTALVGDNGAGKSTLIKRSRGSGSPTRA